jgi:putative flippase GtrA
MEDKLNTLRLKIKKSFSSLSFYILNLPKAVRFIVSGGTAAAVNILVYTILTRVFGLWYIFSTAAAFIVAFFVSFILQKFWTFNDNSTDKIKSQAFVYFFVIMANLGLTTFLMYVAVDIIAIHDLLAVIVVNGLIALVSYFVYQRFIFKKAS